MAVIFDKQSNFNKNANFSLIKIGADAPVLEVELNEMQEIQRERLRSTIKAILHDGVKGTGVYNYVVEDRTLHIQDELIVINGEVIEIESTSLRVEPSQSVYVEVWEEEVTFLDTIPYKGDVNAIETIPNYLVDERIGEETSRRIQLRYRVSTTRPKKNDYLELGYLDVDTFIVMADNLVPSLVNKKYLEVHDYIVLTSKDGRIKHKVRVNQYGELSTERTDVHAPQNFSLVLQDEEGQHWKVYVNEEGELETEEASVCRLSPDVYLQAQKPYAMIYKIGIIKDGQLTTSPLSDIDIIVDDKVSTVHTWSSYKFNTLIQGYERTVRELVEENNQLKKDLEKAKSDMIETVNTKLNSMDTVLQSMQTQLYRQLRQELDGTLLANNIIVSPNSTEFSLIVDNNGILSTEERK